MVISGFTRKRISHHSRSGRAKVNHYNIIHIRNRPPTTPHYSPLDMLFIFLLASLALTAGVHVEVHVLCPLFTWSFVLIKLALRPLRAWMNKRSQVVLVLILKRPSKMQIHQEKEASAITCRHREIVRNTQSCFKEEVKLHVPYLTSSSRGTSMRPFFHQQGPQP